MADIAMCRGEICPKKEMCYRYTAPVTEYGQAMFTVTPYDPEHNKCPYYWSNNGKPKGKQVS